MYILYSSNLNRNVHASSESCTRACLYQHPRVFLLGSLLDCRYVTAGGEDAPKMAVNQTKKQYHASIDIINSVTI